MHMFISAILVPDCLSHLDTDRICAPRTRTISLFLPSTFTLHPSWLAAAASFFASRLPHAPPRYPHIVSSSSWYAHASANGRTSGQSHTFPQRGTLDVEDRSEVPLLFPGWAAPIVDTVT